MVQKVVNVDGRQFGFMPGRGMMPCLLSEKCKKNIEIKGESYTLVCVFRG